MLLTACIGSGGPAAAFLRTQTGAQTLKIREWGRTRLKLRIETLQINNKSYLRKMLLTAKSNLKA